MGDPAELAARLGHRFEHPELLEDALTHRSADRSHNERLEFLGDAVLNFVIAEALYRGGPDHDEGDLTRLRALLVRGETLSEMAAELGLGEHIKLGDGERKSGGRRRHSILADTLEALIGAIFLDAGTATVREVVLGLFRKRLDDLPDPDTLKDAKTRLQEVLQGRGLPRPTYRLIGTQGAHHQQQFTVRCEVDSLQHAADGTGSSRRRAEQAAAAAVLQGIEEGVAHG